ncbi:MAG TPA: cysteine dioxygenase family protein [Thermomicrobiales bacterium]|nr:cysteine dioxygenase family protein [Thermomicrobiales bacterium]
MTDDVQTATDEYVLDTPRLRGFIERVRAIQRERSDPRAVTAAIRPLFADLLADETWLPPRYQEPAAASGMGSGIGQWLLYRAGDGSLALSALVVPPGAATPVHDHLAWGLVGLYRGAQDEEVFTRDDDASIEGNARLRVAERRSLTPGDFYELFPETDIHRVRTTSDITSVSLHLLGIDNGCIWRHRFFPEEQRVEPFRSGYVNQPCDDEGGRG